MPRVLVVDDEENLRLLLRTYLKRHGYVVEVADNGESALALVETFGPDFIVTDVRMPRMGGLDLLTTLKAKDPMDDTKLRDDKEKIVAKYHEKGFLDAVVHRRNLKSYLIRALDFMNAPAVA